MDDLKRIISNRVMLSEKIYKKMFPNQKLNDSIVTQKSLKDIDWTLIFIVEAIKIKNTKLLENYFIWLEKLFEGLNFQDGIVTELFHATKTVLSEEIKNQEIDSFLSRIELENLVSDNILLEDNPYHNHMNEYLNAILNSNRVAAEKVINDLRTENVPIEDIYIFIFQEAMRNVGTLWHEQKITVAREHYCTAITQYIMSTLYTDIFSNEIKHKKLLASAVGSELHELGIRMVADIFELNGWDTTFLGANIPSKEIIAFALEYKPDLIALSITMPHHIGLLQSIVRDIKKTEGLKDVKIIVGGLPFINNTKLNDEIKADGVAESVLDGLKIANEIL